MRFAIFVILLGALLTSAVARADDGLEGAHFWWPGWLVVTSETLAGKDAEIMDEYSHPLIAAFDGDAKTTWKYQPNYNWQPKRLENETRALELAPHRPIFVDAIRILNGDGAPLRQVRVTLFRGKSQVSRTVNFSPAKGWKWSRLPRTQTERVRIEFPKSRRLNIAEIELQNRGRPVKTSLPRAVMMSAYIPACVPILLIDRRGKVLDGIAADIGLTDEWSQSGRYVCGMRGDGLLWIADAWHGRIVKKVKSPRDSSDSGYKWLDNRRIGLMFYDEKKDKRVLGSSIDVP